MTCFFAYSLAIDCFAGITVTPVCHCWWHGNGIGLHMCARDGEILYSHHHATWDCGLSWTLGSKLCKQALDHWPTVPISIWCDWGRLSPKHEDEVTAAPEHPDCIYKIKLEMAKSTLAKLPAWVEASFPALEILHLNSLNYNSMILSDAFLAPSHSAIPHQLLQIKLTNIYFPNLPQLLLSSRNIVSLSLRFNRAVITNFLLPEVIATALSAAFQLEKLSLCFCNEVEGEQLTVPLLSKSPILLSSLNEFCFYGSGDYLEAFVSRIHVPVLEQLDVILWWPHIADFPQLSHFVCRTEQLSTLPHLTSIILGEGDFQMRHCFRHRPSCKQTVSLQVYVRLDRPVSQVHHVCQQLSLFMSSVEQLSIATDCSPIRFPGESKPASWLRMFEPFHCVQDLKLCISKEEGT